MKTILLFATLLASQTVQAQRLEGRELDEILQLYFDGQHEVVKAKLINAGFTMLKATPDYTLNGITHSGDYSLIMELPSKDPAARQMGFQDVSRFFFSTTDYGTSKVVSISFDLQTDTSADAFSYLTYWLGRNTVLNETCTDGPKCRRLITHVFDKAAHTKRVYEYRLSLTNTPLAAGPTRDNLHGMADLRIVPAK